MAGTVGYKAILTSWGSNTQIVSAGNRPAQATINMTCDEFDDTAYAATLVQMLYAPGLRSWSGTFEGKRPTATTGHNGSVAFTDEYTANIREWSCDLSASAFEATVMGDSATTARWKQYLPGLWSGTAQWTCLVDDTTAAVVPGAKSDQTLTLTLASGLTIAGTAFTTAGNVTSAPNSLQTIQYTARFRGNLTVAGSTMPFAAGSSIAIPAIGTMLFKTYDDTSDRQFQGSAFPTRVSIKCPADGEITQSVNFQGTGALTPS